MTQAGYRKRQYLTLSSTGHMSTYSGPVKSQDFPQSISAGTYQRTWSQGNPFRRLGDSEDIGGNFNTTVVSMDCKPAWVTATTGPRTAGVWYTYEGHILPYYQGYLPNGSGLLPPSNLIPYGTRAIARCIPTNPLSGMGQFLGELRDLPKPVDLANWQAIARNFVKDTRRFNWRAASSKAAGEYLNHVFGWVPFIKDLKDFAHVVKHHAPIIRKYAMESGKDLHRRYYFPDETTTAVSRWQANAPGVPVLVDPLYTKKGEVLSTVVTSAKRWFKGSFTYYLPPVYPGDDKMIKLINATRTAEAYANKLLGLRLTPDLVYKLTPWSWALDWVTTTGDVVHNWSAFQNDGLVMRYGYIMETISDENHLALTGMELSGHGPVSCEQTIRRETKSRERATPYGFGVIPTSFSAKQWGIIAALGISRTPRGLTF